MLSLLSTVSADGQQVRATRTGVRGTIRKKALAAAPLAIEDVTVIDVRDGARISHQTVIVEGTRVRIVELAGKVKLPAGARLVDGRGRYLIPGLWDMHSHVHGQCNQDVAYPLLIANGVTGIRDLNVAAVGEALQLRREVAAGARVGPRAIVSGPALNAQEGGPDCRGRPTHIAVPTPERARQVVDSLHAAGADFLKVYEGPSRETLFAIAAEARRVGIPIGGHTPIDGERILTAAEASDSGWRSLEHVRRSAQFCKQPDECAALVARFKRNGTWVTPTLAAVALMDGLFPPHPERLRYSPREVDGDRAEESSSGDGSAWMTDSTTPDWVIERRQTKMLREAGLPMLAGTDAAPVFPALPPGLSLHDELALLVKAGGLTPLEALQAATLNPALYLKAMDSLGTVAAGKLADLVLLDADPLAAIENTAKIRAVVANGRLFDRPALDTLLVEAEQAAARKRAAAPQKDNETQP